MIKGTEIIEKTEIINIIDKDDRPLLAFLSALLVLAVSYGIAWIFYYIYKKFFGWKYDEVVESVVLLFSALLFIFLLITGINTVDSLITKEIPTGKYEYTVRISDDVSFNEIHEKYEIIEGKDGLYTLREKEW